MLCKLNIFSGLFTLILCCVSVIIVNKFGILHFGRVVLVFRRMIRRHPRPAFPVNYRSTGLLRLPRSGIQEPFEIWFSRKHQRSRVDFYYGRLGTSWIIGLILRSGISREIMRVKIRKS